MVTEATVRWATSGDHAAYRLTIVGGMAADVPEDRLQTRTESDLCLLYTSDAADE